MDAKFASCFTSVNIFYKGEHPIFSDGVTKIEVADEAGGVFFLVSQDGNDPLRLELAEIKELLGAAQSLLSIFNLATKTEGWAGGGV